MKNILTLIIIIAAIAIAKSQNISDVVRWSVVDQVGTARTLGVGSSFGSMGGDFSVININPAGIADYRISEFTFTPSLKSYKTDSKFSGAPNDSQIAKGSSLGLDNIGFVFASNPGGNLTSSNFAIGFSRISDLGRKSFLSGKIPGSITTYFAERANKHNVNELDEFVAFPAYEAWAIYDFDEDGYYETDFGSPNQEVQRTQDIIQKGGINELTLGWAGEYKNQINFGLSMGVPFASFDEQKTYKESDPNDLIPVFDDLTFTENLYTSGVGLNFKAGFIYKFMNTVRLGGAFQSPTWYKFTDDYSNLIEYAFTDNANGSRRRTSTSPDGNFEYKITTPWRATGSLGSTIRLNEIRGFVNADIEFVDYTNASYNGTAYSSDASEQQYTNEVNKTILNKLGPATNIRLGAEFGYRQIRLRGGYSIEQSPFNSEVVNNNKVSFGIGFRDDRFFIDLGWRISKFSEGYYPYIVTDTKLDPLANINTTRTRSALTVGFKF
ncbi:MAG: hypothetical protein U0T36_05645 [Saprospiraceae bacterium]